MNRRLLSLGVVAGLAAAAGAAWRLRSDGAPPQAAAPGLPLLPGGASAPEVPDFWQHEVERLDGSRVTLASLRAPRLIVNFWATWCPPCVREMPMLDRVQREWSSRPDGARLLGLAIDRRDAVAEFLARQPVSYTIALAGLEGTQWSRDLGNERGALPFTVAFDGQGRLVQRKLGELTEAELRAWAAG